MSLRVDKGTLWVRDGFTHWPQERAEHRFFKGARDLPPRIVMLDGSGSLSFDVISWLSAQNISLVRLTYQGEVETVIGGAGYAADPLKVQWQIETRNDPKRRIEFCCELITSKIESSLKTLTQVIPDSAARKIAISHAEAALFKIRSGKIQSVDDLRMTEAIVAAKYFGAWQGLPLKWAARGKHPVPEEWLTIAARGSLGGARRTTNRNAKHPVNAILNYAYGMLTSQMHIEAVAEGYDPRRGIMHHDRDASDAFAWVFDVIEPKRAVVDGKVLKFVLSTTFTGADFALNSAGVCRLTPQLARRVAELATG